MQEDTAEIRCGVCGRAYLPGQSIRIVATKRGMVLIHRDCESALKPIGTAQAVVQTRDEAENAEKVRA